MFIFLLFFQIVVPPLPGKAWKRQMPFRGDDGIFEEDFIEDRRKGLEIFVNKYVMHYNFIVITRINSSVGFAQTDASK